jgi:hypothetical protein
VASIQARKEQRKSLQNQHWHPFTDAHSAYLAGDFAALHDLEMREMYGDDWEQHAPDEPTASGDCSADNEYEQDVDWLQTTAEETLATPANEDDWIPFGFEVRSLSDLPAPYQSKQNDTHASSVPSVHSKLHKKARHRSFGNGDGSSDAGHATIGQSNDEVA